MNTFKLLPLVCFAILFASCQQRMYFPNRVNTPGFTGGKEAKMVLSARVNGTGEDTSTSPSFSPALDIAVAPINHLGIIASYRTVQNRYIDESTATEMELPSFRQMGGTFNGNRFDFGAGYFDRLGGRGIVEVYAGYGNGYMERRGDLSPQYNYSSRYHRFFIQPALGFFFDNITFTGGVRVAVNKYYDFKSANPLLEYYIADDNVTRPLNDYKSITDITFVVAEPFINVEAGYKFIRFTAQVGASGAISNYTVSGTFPVYVNLGLVFYYAPRYFGLGKD